MKLKIYFKDLINPKKNTPYKYQSFKIVFSEHKVRFKKCSEEEQDIIFYHNIKDWRIYVLRKCIYKLSPKQHQIASRFIRVFGKKLYSGKEIEDYLRELLWELLCDEGIAKE